MLVHFPVTAAAAAALVQSQEAETLAAGAILHRFPGPAALEVEQPRLELVPLGSDGVVDVGLALVPWCWS